jgi:hypothetical protein
MKDQVFWTTKAGDKIDIDKMDVEHLRNTLKMIVRNWETRRNLEIQRTLNNVVESSLDQNKEMNDIFEIDEFFGGD